MADKGSDLQWQVASCRTDETDTATGQFNLSYQHKQTVNIHVLGYKLHYCTRLYISLRDSYGYLFAIAPVNSFL